MVEKGEPVCETRREGVGACPTGTGLGACDLLNIAVDALDRILRCVDEDPEQYVKTVDAIAFDAFARIATHGTHEGWGGGR